MHQLNSWGTVGMSVCVCVYACVATAHVCPNDAPSETQKVCSQRRCLGFFFFICTVFLSFCPVSRTKMCWSMNPRAHWWLTHLRCQSCHPPPARYPLTVLISFFPFAAAFCVALNVATARRDGVFFVFIGFTYPLQGRSPSSHPLSSAMLCGLPRNICFRSRSRLTSPHPPLQKGLHQHTT